MKGIVYSTDTGILTLKDNIQSGKLAEQYFEMERDPNQIPATMENVRWINKNIPQCVNVIKYNNDIIGFTFIVPANKNLMRKFLSGKISENEMFEEVKRSITYENFETIYLCSAFIKQEYRRNCLALEGFVKSVKKLMEKTKIRPILFYWEYTSEGGKMCRKVAERLNLEAKVREV